MTPTDRLTLLAEVRCGARAFLLHDAEVDDRLRRLGVPRDDPRRTRGLRDLKLHAYALRRLPELMGAPPEPVQ